MTPVTCVECGKEQAPLYKESVKREMIRLSLCFECLCWTQWIGKENAVVVKGVHYSIEPTPLGDSYGYGGARFSVVFNTGRVEETNNLWFQGTIPEWFRSRIPDNASFVIRE